MLGRQGTGDDHEDADAGVSSLQTYDKPECQDGTGAGYLHVPILLESERRTRDEQPCGDNDARRRVLQGQDGKRVRIFG